MFKIVSLFVCSVFLATFSFADIPRFYGEEIIVTASRLPQQLGRSPWNVIVINAEEAESLGAETVADVVRFVPGIDIYATGGRGALNTIRIKGSNASQVLVLVDGCRLNSPLLGTVDMGDILLADIERLEVVTSPLSSIYGSDAISGVVNVITKKTAKDAPTELSLALESYGGYKADLSLGDENFIFTALYDKTNGFRDNSDYLGQDYSLSNVIETAVGGFRWGADYYLADKGVAGVPNTAAQPTSASTPDNRQQDSNINVFLEYEKEYGNSDLSAKVYQYSTEQKYHEYNFITTAFSDYTYRTYQQGVNIQDNLYLKNGGLLSLGLEYRNENGESSNIGNRQVSDLAIYINEEIEQGPLSLSLGARLDQHSTAGQSINPRVGLSLKPSPDLKIWGNIATAFRAPTLNELYWNDPLWFMYGDASLNPEKSVGIQAGVNKYFGEGSVLGLSLFARTVTDQILWEFNSTTFVTQAKNVGRVSVTGWDVQYDADVLEGMDFFANATFQTAIDEEDVTATNVGNDIPYSPRTKFNLGVDWENPLGEIAVVAKHVGERYSNAANNNKLAAYTVTNLNYSRELCQMNVFAKINNLFNTGYSEAVGWHPVSYAILEYPMPGRTYIVGVSSSI